MCWQGDGNSAAIFGDNGMHSLVIYDDLSKQALAYRLNFFAGELPSGPMYYSKHTAPHTLHHVAT